MYNVGFQNISMLNGGLLEIPRRTGSNKISKASA